MRKIMRNRRRGKKTYRNMKRRRIIRKDKKEDVEEYN